MMHMLAIGQSFLMIRPMLDWAGLKSTKPTTVHTVHDFKTDT